MTKLHIRSRKTGRLGGGANRFKSDRVSFPEAAFGDADLLPTSLGSPSTDSV